MAEALPAGVKVGGVAQGVYAGLQEAEAAKVARGIHGGADLDLCLLQGVAGGGDSDAGGKLADAAIVCDDAARVDEGAEWIVRMVGVHGGVALAGGPKVRMYGLFSGLSFQLSLIHVLSFQLDGLR